MASGPSLAAEAGAADLPFRSGAARTPPTELLSLFPASGGRDCRAAQLGTPGGRQGPPAAPPRSPPGDTPGGPSRPPPPPAAPEPRRLLGQPGESREFCRENRLKQKIQSLPGQSVVAVLFGFKAEAPGNANGPAGRAG